MRSFLYLMLLVLSILNSAFRPEYSLLAQSAERQNWYFGVNAGLSFATSPPTILFDGKTAEVNATATVSDSSGNLLFYSDGGRIWNRKHQIMENGEGLDCYDGNFSQQLVIVQHPGFDYKYYLFYISNPNFPLHLHRLNYCIVNMANGDGIVEKKNTRLETEDLGVKITAVEKKGDTFLVVTQADKTGRYFCFKGTTTGLDTTTIINETSLRPQNSFDYGGIRFSPDGNILAVANAFSARITLFKYNIYTGLFSNPLYIEGVSATSLEFSSDGTLLYVTSFSNCSINDLYQYTVSNYSKNEIENSRVKIASGYQMGMLQRASDNHIYIGRRKPLTCDDYGYIGSINNPNSKGSSCDFVPEAIYLGGNSTFQGLPHFPEIIEYECKDVVQLPSVINVCNRSEYVFDLSGTSAQFIWDNGTTSPQRYVNQEGSYWVESVHGWGCTERDEMTLQFITFTHPQLKDTLLCAETTYGIDLSSLNCDYLWPDGSTTPEYEVMNSTHVTVHLEKENCKTEVNFEVNFEKSTVQFQSDTVFMIYKPILLRPSPADKIVWQDGYIGSFYSATVPGIYSITATLNSCVHYDSVVIVKREFLIPNVITPNNDGMNDYFILKFIKPKEHWNLKIFNRYGAKVYESTNYKNDWQGFEVGQVYYYILINAELGVNFKGLIQVIP